MTFFEKFGRDFMTPSDNRWRKLAFKAPLVLWRMGLGPLLGHIFVVITTKGRKSGEARHFMTEYYRDGEKLYVVCAYGPKAQWYKNLMADPYATIQTWKGPERMKATRVTDTDEIMAVIAGFWQRDPVTVKWYFDAKGIDTTNQEDVAAKKDSLHIFRFDPTAAPTPMPLTVDLAWIWPVLLLLRPRRRREKRR